MRNKLIHNLGLTTHYGTILLSDRSGETCMTMAGIGIFLLTN